jgi:hypothetical protein
LNTEELNMLRLTTGKRGLLKNNFSGKEMSAEVNVQYWRWHRETTLNPKFIGIDHATNAFNSRFDGYIGIAPYT